MTSEEKELLLALLQKANEDSLLRVYDFDENLYHVDWIYLEDEIYMKIKEI
jgi:hypothetical protein